MVTSLAVAAEDITLQVRMTPPAGSGRRHNLQPQPVKRALGARAPR